ncbi:MAG: T9SS type A sorting domain-containing protein, partial [Candidatus Eisenbacteria bacterium]
GSTVYAGGLFSNIGGAGRNRIAALDATTGVATGWDPNPNNNVFALAVSGSTVYAGGGFTSIGGLPQSYIAAMGDVTTPTPTLLSFVSGQALPDRVRLTWFAAEERNLTATIYRRTTSDLWSALGRVSSDGTGRIFYEDRDVSAGARYGYRLGVMEGRGEVFLGETWVDIPRAAAFGLAGLRPNPAVMDLTVAFSLPDASPAKLEVLDIAGRRIVAREVGELGPGNHVLNLTEGRTLAPGVYLLRLTQGARALTARASIVR